MEFDFARARNSLKLPISMGGAGLTDPYDTVTGAFLAGLKDGLRSIQPDHPQVFDWWLERFASDIPQDAPMDLEVLLRSVTASFKRCASAFAALDQDETPVAAPPRTITELLDAVGPTQYKITEVMTRLERQKLFSSLPASHRATFLSRASPHGLDFLLAHPSSTSFRMSDEDMSFGLRAVAFLPPTNEDYTVISAALLPEAEREGLHENYDFARALFRRFAHGWVRHFGITHVFGECAKKVGFLVGYEPRIVGIGSRGAADIRIFHYTPDGRDYIIDASVAVADGKAYVQRAANTAGVAARIRVDSKDNKYEPTVRALGKIFKAISSKMLATSSRLSIPSSTHVRRVHVITRMPCLSSPLGLCGRSRIIGTSAYLASLFPGMPSCSERLGRNVFKGREAWRGRRFVPGREGCEGCFWL